MSYLGRAWKPVLPQFQQQLSFTALPAYVRIAANSLENREEIRGCDRGRPAITADRLIRWEDDRPRSEPPAAENPSAGGTANKKAQIHPCNRTAHFSENDSC